MSSLNVTVINAINLINVESFGKSDPYTLIEFQGQKNKSKVIEGNLNPQWDETLSFDLAGASLGPADTLVVKVMDKEKIGNDRLMGTVDVPLNDLASGKSEVKLNLNLFDKNKRPTTGYINIVVKYQAPKRTGGDSGASSGGDQGVGGTADEDGGLDEVDSGGTSQTSSGGVRKNLKHVGKRAANKSYSTKAQDFQVRIKIVEARQLQGGNISPVCKVKIKNQGKQTKVQNSTNSPFWNASFFFNFHISAAELFDDIIIFEIFNSRKLRSNSLIGSFKIDLSMIYEESNHAFINKWLLLSDPEDANAGAKGYLKICAVILGPGDEAPSFSSATQDESDNIESNLLRPAGIQLRPATYILKVYQGEDLPRMDSDALQGVKNLFTSTSSKELVDPFFVFAFAGKEIKTSTKYNCDHPEWNEELKMALQFPSMCNHLKFQLYDWDRLGNNDPIGTLLLDVSTIGSMKDQNGFLPTFGPSFLNFYGSPREYSDLPDRYEALNLGKGDGVAYRGRVLVELTTQFNENSDPPERLTAINSDQLLRISKFLRRRKYRLHTVLMNANMIRDKEGPIEFEVSMGNYGNTMDDTVAASSSCTQPTNVVFDGNYYYFLPWGDCKPCCLVECHWEDISFRLFTVNYFLRIADKLEMNIKKVKVAIAANIPEEEQAQFVISAFDDLIMGCSKPLPDWQQGQSPETELDRNLKILRNQELNQIKVDAMKLREESTCVSAVISDLEGFMSQLKNLSVEPQNSMPDVIIWMICAGKRRHCCRIPAHEVIWSENEDFRGRYCGAIQTFIMKSPILLDEKDHKDLTIPCQVRVRIWLGQEKEEKTWHAMQKEGKLTVMAETYENQASLLGSWTTKSPLMTRPGWSSANGKIKLQKDQINPPPGWAWEGDWFISPEISLYYDKDSQLTEYLEDVFECEMRIPGGNWGAAKTQYTDRKGDATTAPRDVVLREGWKWSEEWKVDFNRPCDEEGWEYTVEASIGGYQPAEKTYHMSRRRRLVRQRKLVSQPPKKGKDPKAEADQHWEYAPMFDLKFHTNERKIDMVRRRRWHRKMISTQPGAPCFFNLGTDEQDGKATTEAPRMYLKFDKPHKWQLRAYIFQARDLLAADQNGFSDPFARVVFCNQSQSTEIIEKSICPTWDQTLIFREVEVYDDPITIQENPPKIIIELFDHDVLGEDELLGRCEAYPIVKLKPDDRKRAVLEWFSITKGSMAGGEILAAFEIYLIGKEELPVTPTRRGNLFVIPDGVRPMMQRTAVEILAWGVRNMKKFQLLKVNSPSVELEIGGNLVQTSIIKDSRKNPNFTNPLHFLDVLLPKEELYMPPINIKVRDNRQFGRRPVVGTCCIKSTEKYRFPALFKEHDCMDEFPELLNQDSFVSKKAPELQLVPELDSLFKGKKPEEPKGPVEDIDWWTKYYASYGKTDKCQKYVDMGYDTFIIYQKELEQCENFNNFSDFCSTFFLERGSNDDYDEDDENVYVGEFKGTFRIYPLPDDRSEPMPFKHLEAGLPSSTVLECLVRVYIIKAYDLQPGDPSGLADPYIEIQIGREFFSSKEEYIPNSLSPEFGKVFEIKASIPICKDLKISILDYDLLGKDDVIGETTIDLESRYLTKYRATCGLPDSYSTSGINLWRDNQVPTAILTDFCIKNRLPNPEFIDDNTLKIGQSTFKLDDVGIISEVPNPHFGSSRERLALHVLRKLPFVKEHIEVRSLYSPLQPGIEQGKIEMWVDIFPVTLGNPGPPFNIKPRLARSFELRIVVRNTYDVILDETNLLGEKMSDIFVKGWIKGIDEKQETDVHYRSLDGEGNFNWRFVFPFKYIPSERCMVIQRKEHFYSLDMSEQRMPCNLVIQVWDNDLFSPDDFLGTVELDLSAIPVPAKTSKNCTLEQLPMCGGKELVNLFECKRSTGIWPIYNIEKGKPELTGKVEMEMELVTAEEVLLRPAGRARLDPNQNPFLEPPQRPATSFFWLTNPWKSFKFIILKNMKYQILAVTLILLLVIFVNIFIFAFPGLLAQKAIGL